MSISELKKKSNINELAQKLASLDDKNKDFQDDPELFWKPTRDKNDNGQAVIRFLPAAEGEDIPFVKLYEHGWKNKDRTSTGFGRWYINKSLNTIGKPDPVAEFNKKLWDTGLEEKRNWLSINSARRTRFVSNILVVEDPANPDNEGKVFLFKYGKKIYEKINEALNPTYEGETPVNIFDPWKGADFKIRVKKVKGWVNYDDSVFKDPSKISKSDDKIEEIWKQCRPLQEFLDPKTFKTYDELKTQLYWVLGETAGNDEPAEQSYEPAEADTVEPKPTKTTDSPNLTSADSEDSDDVESFFAKINQDD